ncbi:uncharacterized protein LOC111114748 [Crassostrea virginica]
MTVVCPRLNPFAADPIVITSLNQYELRLSTYDRKPGAEVTLTCVDDLQLQGQSIITCQDDGNWNFDSRPYCAKPSLYGNPTAEDLTTHDLPDSAKVLIGVLVAVTLVVTIILVYFSCLIRRKMNELQKHQRLKEDFSPADQENKRIGGQGLLNNNTSNSPRGQQTLFDFDYVAISSSDSSVNVNRNNSSKSHSSNSKRGTTTPRTSSKRDTSTKSSPKPKIKLTNHRQKTRRHSETISSKSNTLAEKAFHPVNIGLLGDSKRLNSKRQRSHSEVGCENTTLASPSPSSEIGYPKHNKTNQSNSVAPIFSISGRNNASLHRGSISLGEEDTHHTDLTEINTDAICYGRDPFLWKSVPRDWNSH